MLRRTTVLGVALLVMAIVAGPALAADAKSADDSSTTTSKTAKAKKDPVPTFTNADIAALPSSGGSDGSASAARESDRPAFSNTDLDALPVTGNSNLPSLEDDAAGGSSNRFVIIGTPAPEGEAAAAPAESNREGSAESMRWVEQMLEEREHAARLANAQRRVRRAAANVEEVERTYRKKGSAFSEGHNTDRLFMRGVASTSFKYDDAIREAYIELAEARAELEALLARSAARRTGTTGAAS